jgi:hypothetical protein
VIIYVAGKIMMKTQSLDESWHYDAFLAEVLIFLYSAASRIASIIPFSAQLLIYHDRLFSAELRN